MFQPIGTPRPAPAVDDDIAVRVIDVTEADEWAETAAQGWSESPEVVPFVRAIGAVYARVPRARCFLATVGGTPAAAGVLLTHEGVALLGGASTVPAHRRRGAQLALLHARLEAARHIGCDLAMMSARPGSGSQRNAERHGFRIAYTRIKWRLSNP